MSEAFAVWWVQRRFFKSSSVRVFEETCGSRRVGRPSGEADEEDAGCSISVFHGFLRAVHYTPLTWGLLACKGGLGRESSWCPEPYGNAFICILTGLLKGIHNFLQFS